MNANNPPKDYHFVLITLESGEEIEGWYDHNIKKWYGRGTKHHSPVVKSWREPKQPIK